MTVCPHCFTDSATLQAQSAMIDKLEHEVADLRGDSIMSVPQPDEANQIVPPGSNGLTLTQTRILSMLLIHERVSWQSLFEASGSQSEDPANLIKVHICKLRKKLQPLGLSIQTIWGWGYSMPREVRDAAKAKLAA